MSVHQASQKKLRHFSTSQHQIIPNQWRVFFVRSDWLLRLGIASAIHLLALFWISRARSSSFLREKGTIWYWLSTGLVYTKTIIHLSVSEE